MGIQKERGGEMEVEIIKAKGAGEDTSTGRKIDRLRVIIQWSDITRT